MILSTRALISADPYVGRTHPLQVRIKWDFDDTNGNFDFTVLDCWRVNVTAYNATSTETC